MSQILRRAVKRHLVLIGVLAVALGAAGFVVGVLLPTSYTSTASVLIRAVPGNSLSPAVNTSSGTQATVAMTTELSLVTTPAIADLASKTMGREVPADKESVGASVPPSTQIIRISYTAPTAQAAQQGAQAYAEAFLGFRADNAKRAQEALLASLNKQLATATDALKTASVQAATQTDPRAYAAQQVQLYAERIASLNSAISIATTVSQDPGTVIQDATVPKGSNGIPPVLLAVAGAAIGLLVGLLLALGREFQDDRLRTGDEDTAVGLPILAVSTTTISLAKGSLDDPHSPADESIRQLRTALVTLCPTPSVVALSSVGPAADSAGIALNLGAALVHAGYRVAVVDATITGDSLFRRLDVADATGMGELESADDLPAALVSVAGMSVLGVGLDHDRARDAFAGPLFRTCVDRLRSTFDYVIVVADAAGSADADAACAAAEATLLVGTDGTTTHPELAAARDRVERLGAPAIGVAAVPKSRRRTSGASGASGATGSAADQSAQDPLLAPVGPSQSQ